MAKAMIAVRGHFRTLPDGGRVWIAPHLRAVESGEAARQGVLHRSLQAPPMVIVAADPTRMRMTDGAHRSAMGRYGGHCATCQGRGWILREPPSATSPTVLCPKCQGSGRG